MQRSVLLVCLVCLCTAVASCGPTYTNATVTGKLLIDGQPAPRGVKIIFAPQEKGSSQSYGYTNDAGAYRLRFNAQNIGANAGENLVSIGVEMQFDDQGNPYLPEDLKKIRTGLPDNVSFHSTLVKTVTKGPNTIDLDVVLESKKR